MRESRPHPPLPESPDPSLATRSHRSLPQQLISAPNSFPNHRESRAPASALCLRTSPPRNRERRPVGSIDSYSRPSPAAQGATPSPSPPFPSQQPYRLSNAVLADARNHTGGRLYPTAVASPR